MARAAAAAVAALGAAVGRVGAAVGRAVRRREAAGEAGRNTPPRKLVLVRGC